MFREIKDMAQLMNNVPTKHDQSQSSAINKDLQDLSEIVEDERRRGQTIQQELREILEERPRFEEVELKFKSAGELTRRANNIFQGMLLEFEALHDEMANDLQIREIIEIQIRAVSLGSNPPKIELTED